MDNFFVAQIPVIVFIIFMIIRMVIAFKRNFVNELWGLLALILSAFIVLLISFGFRAHFTEDSLIAWSGVVLVILMLVLYKLLEVLFTSFKFMAKLSDVSKADRVVGPLIAILETVVLIWGVYSIMLVMNRGAVYDIMMSSAKHNIVMKFLYEYNYIYILGEPLKDSIVKGFNAIIKVIDPSKN